MAADAGAFAQVVANTAEHTGQRIILPHYAQRLGGVAVTHGIHVLRDLLINRALIDTRCLDAVEQTEFTRRLRV